MFHHAEEKGNRHDDPKDPPRQCSNPKRGRGTAEGERPVVVGILERESGCVHIAVAPDTKNATLLPRYADQLDDNTTLYSDEAHHVQPLEETVANTLPSPTVRTNMPFISMRTVIMGSITIPSNGLVASKFLRSFRGVHKHDLPGYVAMFELAYDLASVTTDFVRTLVFSISVPYPYERIVFPQNYTDILYSSA